MNRSRFHQTTLSTVLLCAAASAFAQPEADVKEFVPFNQFQESIRSASVGRLRPNSRVTDAKAFEDMRQHIAAMYRGAHVSHSFVMNSNHFDCIGVADQPAVRALGLASVAAAPPSAPAAPVPNAKKATQLADGRQTDQFGNQMSCEANSFPMRRLTLDELTQYPTLEDFFRKGPQGTERPADPSEQVPSETAATPTAAHKYSFMYQNVDNLGGNSSLNLWSPYVNTDWNEVFSLSQQWYVGGSGANTQTAEVGWQNYPRKYGNQNSRLFIFWTADNYVHTGCYNLDCPAFVQVDNSVVLGGGWANYSAVGGDQWEFSAQFLLYQGNWWLAIGDTWVGYYPGSLYNGGQMAYNAQKIEYGSESVGTTVWPGEGSGNWATSGFGSAAYQRNVFYTGLDGNGYWSSLKSVTPSPACYNTAGPYFDANDNGWGAYFYEGGPGGGGC